MPLNRVIAIYFLSVSFISFIITVADKINAKRGKRRVPEDFLLTIGLLGGALAEYITMLAIRHKTRHKKFMLGLPSEIIFQIIIAILINKHI